MKKLLIKLYDYDKDDFQMLINSKIDLISLLLKTLSYIIIDKTNVYKTKKFSNDYIEIIISKFSRQFVYLDKKVYSFVFPFVIRSSEHGNEIFYHDIKIDNIKLNALSSIFKNIDKDDLRIDEIHELIFETIIEFPNLETEQEVFILMITSLLTYEPGYFRYDIDERRLRNHPLNHIDVYYSKKATFKIETTILDDAKIKDILDLETKPWLLYKK